ncbi:AAA family ATPase [Pseudalkalibacillus hwajinpoensis]|uniref:AAA family ATPase n=1 Tax=Guptibacillus hwajinpoensis TaxID=208199 RepID=UPI00325AADCC
MTKSIYLVSGPCGVGKSTITKTLAHEMEGVVLIEGDVIHSMFIGQEQPPWDEQLEIDWKNILSLTKNFVENNLNVIIDYVVETELEWFCKQLSGLNVHIHYVVLRADEGILIERLNKRGDHNLVDRSLQLLEELESRMPNKKYLYDTTNKQPSDIVVDLRGRFKQFRL